MGLVECKCRSLGTICFFGSGRYGELTGRCLIQDFLYPHFISKYYKLNQVSGELNGEFRSIVCLYYFWL